MRATTCLCVVLVGLLGCKSQKVPGVAPNPVQSVSEDADLSDLSSAERDAVTTIRPFVDGRLKNDAAKRSLRELEEVLYDWHPIHYERPDQERYESEESAESIHAGRKRIMQNIFGWRSIDGFLEIKDGNVTIVNLSDTTITDNDLVVLKSFVHLRGLILSRTQITDEGLKQLQNLTGLEGLDLGGTSLTDKGLEDLKAMSSLMVLDLSFTKISDAGLQHLENMTNLRSLSVAGTQVTNDGMLHLKTLRTLQKLNLQQTSVTDGGLAHLKDLRAVETLNLSHTPVTDHGLEFMMNWPKLTRLYVMGTSVTETGVHKLEYNKCEMYKHNPNPQLVLPFLTVIR